MGCEELLPSRCSGRQVSERAVSLRAIVYSLPPPGLIYLTTLLPLHKSLVKTTSRHCVKVKRSKYISVESVKCEKGLQISAVEILNP